MRTLVKDAFGLRSAAPEVVVCLLQKGTLDPYMRWLIAGLRLWYHVLREGPTTDDVDEVIEEGKGWLGKCALESFRWGIRITPRGFELADPLLSRKNGSYLAGS